MNDKASAINRPSPTSSRQNVGSFILNLAIRPLYYVRHNVLGKLLILLASLYLIIVLSLYLFANDYYTSLPLATPWSGFQWSLGQSAAADRLSVGHSDPILGSPDFDYGYALEVVTDAAKARTRNFNWGDWVDLSAVKGLGNVTKESPNYPLQYASTRSGQLWKSPVSNATEKELAYNGKMFLSHNAPDYMNVVVLGKKAGRYFIGRNNSEQDMLEKYEALPPLVDELTKPISEKISVTLPIDLFSFDIDNLKTAPEDANKYVKQHAKDLAAWTDAVGESKKYFEECYMHDDRFVVGNHYDWRFFDGVRRGEEHQASMHHLIRVWNAFANQENIAAWIAHGSLLGWYWNGAAMPWDNDNDVQMPIMELDRFAQLYNQTLIVQDPTEGTGRYFIDISPWYVQRVRGNGHNVIDARFIDIRSGIYLDITGLAVTGAGMANKRVNCKNHHYYQLETLSPLRNTLYEGSLTFVPNDFGRILAAEYKNYRSPIFMGWSFNRWLRLWVGRRKCDDFQDNKKRFDSNGDLLLYGACNDVAIWEEYNITRTITELHYEEMNLYYDNIDWVPPEAVEEDESEDSEKNDESKKEEMSEDNKKMIKALKPVEDIPGARERMIEILSGYYPPLRFDPA